MSIFESDHKDCHSAGDKKHIDGIVCNVHNCEHHDCETHCTAKEIAVGPSFATNATDTVCATFKMRKE